MTKIPIEFLTSEEQEQYQRIKAKVRVLDETWRRIGGDDLQRELSLATLEMVRLEELARKRKATGK